MVASCIHSLGSISFRDFLEATIPGVVPQQIEVMISWVKKKPILQEEDYYTNIKKPTVKLMQEDSFYEFQKMYDLYNTSKSGCNFLSIIGVTTIIEFKEALRVALVTST